MTEKTSELWKKLKPYAVRDLSAGTTGGGNATGSEVGVHDLDGAKHTGTLSWVKVSKVGSSLADLVTREADDLVATSGTERDVLSVTGAGVIDYETPSSDGTVANTLLRTDASGFAKVADFEIEKIGGGNPTLLFDAGIGNAAIEFDATGPELIIKANAVDFFRMNSSSQIITQSQDISTLKKIESAGYSGSAFEDMSLDFNTGVADFHTVYTNNLIAEKFVAGVKLAQIGNVTVGHSMAILSRDWVVPAKGSTATMYIKNVPGVGDGYQAFQQFDRLLINFFNIDSGYVGGQLYIRITSTITTSGDEQYFTAEYMNVSANDVGMVGQTVYAETTVVDLSANGTPNTGGYWEASTLESAISGGPFGQIVNMVSPNPTSLTLTPILRSGYIGGLGKIGGGSFSAGDLGFWFSPDISDNTEPAFYVTDIGDNAMRNIDMEIYSGSTKFFWLNPTDGMNLRPIDANASSVSWGYKNAINFPDLTSTTVRGTVGMAIDNTLSIQSMNLGIDDAKTSNYVTLGLWDDTTFNEVASPRSGIRFQRVSGTDSIAMWSGGDFQFRSTAGNFELGDGVTYYPTLEVWGSTDLHDDLTLDTDMYMEGDFYIDSSKWRVYFDANHDLIFRDTTASYNPLVLDYGGSEVRLNAGNHKFGNESARFNGTWFVSEGTGNELGDFTDPTGGQIIIKEGDDAGPLEGSLISIKPLGWSRIGAIAFNAYYNHNSGAPFSNTYGNWRFHGAQSTATRAGAFFFAANSGDYYWYVTPGTKTDDAQITDWSQTMRLNSDGDLIIGGDLLPNGVIGEDWATVTYESTTWEAQTFGPNNVQYKVFGSVVFLRGLAKVKTGQGWSTDRDDHVFTVSGVDCSSMVSQIFPATYKENTTSDPFSFTTAQGKVVNCIAEKVSATSFKVSVRDVSFGATDWVGFDGCVIHLQ